MKIGPSISDGSRVDGRTVGPERAAPVRAGSTSEPVRDVAGVDRVSLSGSAERIARQSALPFDESKVEEIRRAIAEGRFPVDAKRVAEELLADTRDFAGFGAAAR
jgi:flagellar biosynthesis anti-sigma factor FlgM